MPATPLPLVGVAGAPDVAAALREIGFTVITGRTFREAAIAIAAQLKQSPVPVVVEAMSEPGFTPWVLSTQGKADGLILLPTNDSVDLSALASVMQLPLPSTVNDLLVMMGAAPALAAAGATVIGQASAPEPTPAPAPAPVAETVAAPVPAPAPTPAPAPVATDPFAEMVRVAAGSPVAAEAHVPVVEDPFDTLPGGDALGLSPAAPEVLDPFQTTPAVPAPSAPEVTDPFEQMVQAAASAPTPFDDPHPVAPAPVDRPVVVSVPRVEPAPAEDPFLAAMTAYIEPEPSAVPDAAAPEPAAPFVPAPDPQPAPAPVRTPDTFLPPAPATVPSDFIQQVQARREIRPLPAFTPPPSLTPGTDTDFDFFRTPGISTGGCQVIVSLAGKGGVGKTSMALMYAQTAGAGGMRVLLIDANRDQGDIGTSLRIERAGLPTVLQAINGAPGDAIVTAGQANAARPSASQEVTFDVVLAPPREFAGPRYASAQVYARLLAYAKGRYELVIIDTQITEAHKSDLHMGFVIPELRSGAWSAGIADYDYSAIRNAFAVFDELTTLGVTPQRTLIIASRWPEKESDQERFVSQFGQYGTFMGFVADDPNIKAQKSIGNILIGSPAVEPVVRTLLYRVTNKGAFAPVEDKGRRRKTDAPGGQKPRRGLFGGRR